MKTRLTWSPFSSFRLAASKPSRSDGTHTIFLAAQSAWARPLLRKSFSENRYLLSSVGVSAMSEASSLPGEPGIQMREAESIPVGVEAEQPRSGLWTGAGSVSGPLVGHGLTSELTLVSALWNQPETLDVDHS